MYIVMGLTQLQIPGFRQDPDARRNELNLYKNCYKKIYSCFTILNKKYTLKHKLFLALIVIYVTVNAQGTWTQKTNFGGTGRYGSVGFAIGTKGYIGCGYDGTFCPHVPLKREQQPGNS